MRYLPEIESLQTFLAVAEELSFRRAADRMNIDHSVISKRIKDLELRVGFPLFYRTTRAVQLTEAGRVLYEGNHGIVASLRKSIEAARRVSDGRSGRLRLGYMAFAATTTMPAALSAFSQRFPEVSVELNYMGTQAQKIALARHEIDAAFLIGPFEHDDFETLCVSDEALVGVVPVGHDRARCPSLSLADLARSPLILGDVTVWGFYRLLLDDLFAACGLDVRPRFEPSSTLGILGLVSAGLGVTLLPDGFRTLTVANVLVLPISDCQTRIQTLVVCRRIASRTTRHFVEACRSLTGAAA